MVTKTLTSTCVCNSGVPTIHPLIPFLQLKYASGSLAQFLDVEHAEKLNASSAVDDVKGKLLQFLPSGAFNPGQREPRSLHYRVLLCDRPLQERSRI